MGYNLPHRRNCVHTLPREIQITLCIYKSLCVYVRIIIIMQLLTRHVSVIRLTNRRRGVTWIYG